MPQKCSQDAIDRKMGFFERIFDRFFQAVNKDLKGFFIVILVIFNAVIFWKYTESLEARLIDNQEYSERMINEVKNRIMPEIDDRMDAKVEEIGKKVDSAAVGMNELQKGINDLINVVK